MYTTRLLAYRQVIQKTNQIEFRKGTNVRDRKRDNVVIILEKVYVPLNVRHTITNGNVELTLSMRSVSDETEQFACGFLLCEVGYFANFELFQCYDWKIVLFLFCNDNLVIYSNSSSECLSTHWMALPNLDHNQREYRPMNLSIVYSVHFRYWYSSFEFNVFHSLAESYSCLNSYFACLL